MRVGELCLRLGLNEDVVRPELERMKVRREVARLRVVGGGGEDFYRLCDTGLGQIPAAEVVFTDDPMTCMIAQQNPNNGLTLR
jgi:DNA-binding transcriptional regulator PaaX